MDEDLSSGLNGQGKSSKEGRVDGDPRNKYPFNEGKTSDGDLLGYLFDKLKQGVITRCDYDELFSAFAKIRRNAGGTDPDDDESIFDLAVPRHQAKVLRDMVIKKHPQIKHEFEELYRRYERLTREEGHKDRM